MITISKHENVYLVELDDSLLEPEGIAKMEEFISHYEEGTPLNCMVDFTKCRIVTSKFLGILIRFYKIVEEKGGLASSRGVDPQMERMFRLAGLGPLLLGEKKNKDR